MKNILLEKLNIDAIKIKKLIGLENTNYLVESSTEKYIFKTYPYTKEVLSLIIAENDTLLFLHQNGQLNIPKPIAFKNDEFVAILNIEGKKSICRLLSYLNGKFLVDIPHTKKMFQSFGTSLAELDTKLTHFHNDTIKARRLKWDIQHLNLSKKHIKHIPSAKDRSVVYYFFKQYDENVLHRLPDLRTSIIHNDANEWNVLFEGEVVSGIIDFGDLTHSLLINELANAITFSCYDKNNPLDWASIIIKSYHKTLPLDEIELDILYYLIAARLCISVCNSAYARSQNTEDEYAFNSEKFAWQMLYRWLAINPISAKSIFRETAGYHSEKMMPVKKVLAKRQKHISPIVKLSYNTPIYMDGAAFQYMYDKQGNTYLDAYNNIPHVGHSHPKVIEAGQRQMAKLNTNTRYLYDSLNEYSEKLLSKFPGALNKVYFVNSGSAATDLALRLARSHTGHKKILAMEHGYHGNAQEAIDVSHYKFNNPKGQGKINDVSVTPIPDTYRGKYTTNDGSAGRSYANDAIAIINETKEPFAAFICEPIVGCGGQIPLAKGYLKHIYPVLRKQGGVCIVDEVQTGFGRLGDYFWGYEIQEIVPDIVILGKPMANGHPMAAVVCTSDIALSFEKGVEFHSSFGGNPVSCAIALSVLEVLEEEKLQERAKSVGDHFKLLLIQLATKYPCIGDIRGFGLFLGIDIVKDHSLEPDTELAEHITNELKMQFTLINTDGPHENVLKIKPSLRFTKEDAQKTVNQIEIILSKHYKINKI